MGLWMPFSSNRKPWGLRWRSSVWFITTGITTDLLVYSIIIPRLSYHKVSSLTGWLLSTIPIAMHSERYSMRRMPLIFGLIALIGSQVMFMEAPNYAVMAIARVLQGISSSMVWIVGLALFYPENIVLTSINDLLSEQLGIAMTGLSIGLLVGSPAGGALYSRFGFRAPFIFGSLCAVVDLLLRLLLIERNVALKWGYDPSEPSAVVMKEAPDASSTPDIQLSSIPIAHVHESTDPETNEVEEPTVPDKSRLPNARKLSIARRSIIDLALNRRPTPLLSVIVKLSQSPRALVALTMAFVYGLVQSMQEPSLPLHLQSVWGFNSGRVGLAYLAAVVPALIYLQRQPLAGFYVDRAGSDYITCICLFLALPWWIVLTLQRSLPLFIFALAAQCFFVSGVVAPVTTELASVSRKMAGVGYAHVYGAFNLAFGIGTAVGPVIGGQIYDRARHGWTVLCCITSALILVCITLAFCYTGVDPLLAKVLRHYYPIDSIRKNPDEESNSADNTSRTHIVSRVGA
ncbi:major facilitator superfamily domain-containing protein [Suillus subalutaceus]|uniref:major facilitator superfamily domain-containing protein n=1 Tax=Suillus subalutaceus TaxID=48586 RepID=UPI001B882E7A|nr:major facilitator superfamily domain-containing protein [Suillus subalutaceus]KAG1841315.1 major facilitator superfamily domain-containing protein [Suillus subalutaceus]